MSVFPAELQKMLLTTILVGFCLDTLEFIRGVIQSRPCGGKSEHAEEIKSYLEVSEYEIHISGLFI